MVISYISSNLVQIYINKKCLKWKYSDKFSKMLDNATMCKKNSFREYKIWSWKTQEYCVLFKRLFKFSFPIQRLKKSKRMEMKKCKNPGYSFFPERMIFENKVPWLSATSARRFVCDGDGSPLTETTKCENKSMIHKCGTLLLLCFIYPARPFWFLCIYIFFFLKRQKFERVSSPLGTSKICKNFLSTESCKEFLFYGEKYQVSKILHEYFAIAKFQMKYRINTAQEQIEFWVEK